MEQSFLASITLQDGRKRLKMASTRYFFTHCISKYPVGAKLSVTLTDKRPTRSDRQHRYYWAYLSQIAEETGHSKDELHTFFKGKFLSEGMTEIYGHKVRSTTTLTKGRFAEYIMEIYSLTAIEPPDPKNWDFAPMR